MPQIPTIISTNIRTYKKQKIKDSQGFANEHPNDVTIQYPVRREYFMENFQAAYDEKALVNELKGQERASMYFHIPFCEKKCSYCNFAVDVRGLKKIKDKYVEALVKQGKRVLDIFKDKKIIALDIGGGTPTNLEPEQIRKFMEGISGFTRKIEKKNPNTFSAETTTKIAAEHIERLHAYHDGGVQRISMGVQSTSQAVINSVNRLQELAPVYQAYKNLRGTGFKRINFDFIFGLPGQTKEHIQKDIDLISELRPDSVTMYDCIYKGKGRALKTQIGKAPTRAQYGELYDYIYEGLNKVGYHSEYGSLNFSLHRGESGTSKYFEERLLKHGPFVGLGNYSSSQVNDKWWFAPYSVDSFIHSIKEQNHILPINPNSFYQLPNEELAAKDISMSFNYGFIDIPAFIDKFGLAIEKQFGEEIDFAIMRNWLEYSGEKIKMVKGSFKDLSNIRALFYSNRILQWLKNLK